MSLKKISFFFLRLGVSVALLIFLFKQVDPQALFGAIQNANKAVLIFAFILFAGNYIFAFLRWLILLKAYQIDVPLRKLLVFFCGGILFNSLLPSTVGGDFVRSIDLAAFAQKPRQVVATVFLDRLSGYSAVVCVALLALAVGYKTIHTPSVILGISAITLLLAVILLMLFNRFVFAKTNSLLDYFGGGRIAVAVKNLHREIHVFRHQKAVILKVSVLSLFIQVIGPLVGYIISLGLGIHINIIYFFIFLPVVGAITLLPISIGGLGLRDAAVIFFFAQAGVSRDLSFAMSLLGFFFTLAYSAIGGLIYIFGARQRQ